MLKSIEKFIETNSNAIVGVVFHRNLLNIVLKNNQKVFDTSILSNEECQLVVRAFMNVPQLSRRN